jgi:hypothetical protein
MPTQTPKQVVIFAVVVERRVDLAKRRPVRNIKHAYEADYRARSRFLSSIEAVGLSFDGKGIF